MTISRQFEDYVVDRLRSAGVGDISSRRMFGGAGIYLDGIFFALIAPDSNALYFRVDDSTRGRYEDLGMRPFRPRMKGKTAAMPYYEVPEDILEDNGQLRTWARQAHTAAAGARRPKKTKPTAARKKTTRR